MLIMYSKLRSVLLILVVQSQQSNGILIRHITECAFLCSDATIDLDLYVYIHVCTHTHTDTVCLSYSICIHILYRYRYCVYINYFQF